MGLRVRYRYQTGSSLGYSIERLSDGLFYNFATTGATAGTFTASPAVLVAPLPEDVGNYLGRYKVTMTSTPLAQFTDGEYCVTIHDLSANNTVVGELSVVMHGGDDAPVFSGTGGGSDPWAIQLPGSYPAGSAGAIIGNNLDARISTRSTYAGGPVASVLAPVTVGTNTDKTGYALSAAGLDPIKIETGINMRQAMSPILAAAAGTLTGAGTGTIVIKGANVVTTRITAITDSSGNRTSVTLALPA